MTDIWPNKLHLREFEHNGTSFYHLVGPHRWTQVVDKNTCCEGSASGVVETIIATPHTAEYREPGAGIRLPLSGLAFHQRLVQT